MIPAHVAPFQSGVKRCLIALGLASFTWPGNEFDTEGWALWYQTRAFGIPISYPIIAGVLVMVMMYFRVPGRLPLQARLADLHLWRWVVLGWFTIVVALALAVLRQSPDPFVDWRNWATLALTAVVLAGAFNNRPLTRFILSDLAIAYGAISITYLLVWAAGGGTNLYGVRIPLFNGYDLGLAVFAALVAATVWIEAGAAVGRLYRALLGLTVISTSLLVILSFRRSLWAFLVIGLGIVGWKSLRGGRLRPSVAIQFTLATLAVGALAVAVLGTDPILERLGSFNPLAENQYSATNEDHVNDLIDAVGVIGREPVFGLGIGQRYKTDLIADWKPESFEVHNAFLNVWLKFGLLGLFTFIGFHLATVRALWRTGRLGVPALTGAGTALVAEQVVNLVQPWPYASLQYSLHRGIVFAVLLTVGWQQLSHANFGSTVPKRELEPAS